MKTRESTKELFWLNFWARIQMTLGFILLMICLVLLVFKEVIVSLVPLGIGVVLVVRGKIQRLEYERSSGYIIHQG